MKNQSEIIKWLEEIRKDIKNFKDKSKKYPVSHIYYKENLKKLKLKIRAFLLQLQKVYGKVTIPEDIYTLLNSFLAMEKPLPKDCEKLIDSFDIKIQDFELNFEEDFLEERIYDEKSRFDFRTDLKDIFDKANKKIFIIDSWIDEDLLEVYLKKIKRKIEIRILSGENPKGKIIKLINDFNNQYNSLEVKESPKIHDRAIFIDDKFGWVMGQSIKDAAKNKPTYLIKLKDAKKLENIYNKIYLNSKKIK